eukprot:TRINITY_DN107_c1_g1_i5.p2 TRINITY_DN107_c1_g1~~TRINITY_DN107_c1_g1_i5.p2  ORF type:complete len:207 (-),score=8.21 TRINITY_DN107_c1_g1_i5:612-1232(-)
MEIGRRMAWILFFINLFLCLVYAIIGFISFAQILNFSNQNIKFYIVEVSDNLDLALSEDVTDETKGQIRGLISATFLSSLVACVFVVSTFFLMLVKLLGWGFGFTYGFVCSSAFNGGIILLLTGINMLFWKGFWERAEKYFETVWDSSKTTTFFTVAVLAITMFAWFIIYLVFLLFAKNTLDPDNDSPIGSKSNVYSNSTKECGSF